MALQYACRRDGSFATPNELPLPDRWVSGHMTIRDDAFVTLDYTSLLSVLIEGRLAGESVEALAYLFHELLATGVVDVCVQIRARTGLGTVALSGGCFCNRLLLRLTMDHLKAAGFRVLTHHQIPANDGGIALGQAVYAMQRTQGIEDA